MANILVFGTSTTYGAWDLEGGWVQRLRRSIDQKIIDSNYKLEYLLYNLGVSGNKSADVLKRFAIETDARLGHYNDEIIFIFHLGVNDCIYNNTLKKLEVLPEEFKDNYRKIIDLAKKISKKIIIVGSMPVDKRVDPMPWSRERSYKNEYVGQFNKLMEEVANENKVLFVEVYDNFINKNYSDLLADGVHMNTQGHKKMFEIINKFLIKNKIITI